MPDSISGFDLFVGLSLNLLNNFGSLHLPQRVMYRTLIRPFPGSINYQHLLKVTTGHKIKHLEYLTHNGAKSEMAGDGKGS